MMLLVDKLVEEPRLLDFVLQLPELSPERDLGPFLDMIAERAKKKPLKAACRIAAIEQSLSKAGFRTGKDALSDLERQQSIDRAKAFKAEFGDEYAKAAGIDATIFALEHLYLGAIAPDIEGKDQNGVAFRLSNYCGKVVLLDFWADW
jgi:hypothetical protein